MGYRAVTIDELGDGFMRKVREPLGVTAFGVNALVLPAGTEWFNHRHERQDELYVVQRGCAGFDVDGETFEGYRAAASGDSKGLVLIIHDWDGLTEYELKRADMLADMGYDAFAVDLFGKGNRPIETEAKKKETGRLYQDRERMRSRLVGGLQEARKASDQKVVVMG